MALITNNTIYLHYPKCGGTSLKIAAYAMGMATEHDWHTYCEANSHEGYDFYRERFPEHRIVGVIRHPLEVYFSEYNYKRSADPFILWKGLRQRGCEEAHTYDFASYVHWGLTADHGDAHKNENHWLVFQHGMRAFFGDARIITVAEAFANLGLQPLYLNRSAVQAELPEIVCGHPVYLDDLEFYYEHNPSD